VTVIDLGTALADILSRGEDAEAIQDQARHVGGCEQPIRLRGQLDTVDRATGEVEQRWSSEQLVDGVVHTRCNNRRASRCEPCSRLYQQDAWQLIVAGLAGGKGVLDTVAEHPTLFVTLTAPSFGPVHTRTTNDNGDVLPCRARRDEACEVCAHGQPTTCTARHAEDDPALGRPLCMGCWDYAGAVLFNAHASELWRRTRIRIYRELAGLVGLSERALKQQVSVQYVKIAEYQRRGLVHFHALIRLDAARPPAVQRLGVPWRLPHHITPPPKHYTVELLAHAVRNAIAHTEVPYPDRLTEEDTEGQTPARRVSSIGHRRLPDVTLVPKARCARWGAQIDLRPVQAEERGKVAGYLAKYATKHTECVGGLDQRLTVDDLALLPLSEHARRLVVVAGGWPYTIQSWARIGGRISSATAATSSPNPATTQPPSPRCAQPGCGGRPGSGRSTGWTRGSCSEPPRDRRWSNAGRSPGSAGGCPETPCSPTPSDNKSKPHAKPPKKLALS
jgi:hypothetical protein